MTGRASTRSGSRSREGAARLAQGGTSTVTETAAPVLMRNPGRSGAPVPVPPAQDGGMGIAESWPLQDFLELGALPGAVPSARMHARSVLWEWD